MESSCNVEEKRAHRLADPGSGFSVVLDSPESGLEAQSPLKPRPAPSSSRYKGVVPQPNGRWGAQIYEKHRRVWLGTFTRQSDAAAAYDAASRRFRGPHAAANFRIAADAAELAFLESHSKAEVVDMLRKHTYEHELLESKRAFGGQARAPASLASSGPHKILFEKAVTPSDVGKLNRLVIPKQHAEKYFPATDSGVLINFEDLSGRVWRFRYSYWGSSQSYVLTKGWSRFVKEHSLKAGDVVSFQRSTGMESKLFIACRREDSFETSRPAEIFRLFGVNIAVDGGGRGLDCGSGKRRREEYWLKPSQFFKKQCTGNLQ